MRPRLIVITLALAAAAACSDNSSGAPDAAVDLAGDGPAQDLAPDAEGTPDNGAKPDLTPGVDAGTPCSAQDAAGVGSCKKLLGYRWDGAKCASLSGCSCSGKDCAKLYPDSASCAKAHAHCATKPSCAAMDAQAVGACGLVLGVTWTGSQCKTLSGCSCSGKDCAKLFKDVAACQKANAHCPAACQAMDVKGIGDCEKHMGWYWNGKTCQGLSGCSCSGVDCAKLFQDKGACQAAYKGCP